MSSFIGVNGTAREVKKIHIGVDGIAREVKKAWVGVNGIARLFYENALTISELPVGTLISMNVSGVATHFIVVHQGLPSNDYDSSCDGVWLLMKDCADSNNDGDTDSVVFSSESNNNSYKESELHSYLNNDFLNSLDASVQNQIKTVRIPYVNGLGGSDVASGADGLETKVFALSNHEAGFVSASTNYMPAQQLGSVLTYFNGVDDTRRICHYTYNDYTGKATWSLRTPHEDSDAPNQVFIVDQAGKWNLSGVTVDRYPRPALVLPHNVTVNPMPNADGSYTLLV